MSQDSPPDSKRLCNDGGRREGIGRDDPCSGHDEADGERQLVDSHWLDRLLPMIDIDGEAGLPAPAIEAVPALSTRQEDVLV